jgi:hypothetical protein
MIKISSEMSKFNDAFTPFFISISCSLLQNVENIKPREEVAYLFGGGSWSNKTSPIAATTTKNNMTKETSCTGSI